MTIREWNDMVRYAESKCKAESEKVGIPFFCTTYKIYNGQKGIRFFAKDDSGNLFMILYSGIHERAVNLKSAINSSVSRLVYECC